MAALEDALAAPAPGRDSRWMSGVAVALANLQMVMADHIVATEGPSGFHAEIVSAAPRLAHQVTLSVREHARIVDLIRQLLEMVAPSSAADVIKTREIGTSLLGLLAAHRQRGADMIFEAYEADVGGED